MQSPSWVELEKNFQATEGKVHQACETVKEASATAGTAPQANDQAYMSIRYAPLLFIALPFIGIGGLYDISMTAIKAIVDTILSSFMSELIFIIPSVLMASFLAGTCNKVTDLIDDEGLLGKYQNTPSLFLLQVALKTYFPAFFVLLFAFNLYAAGVFGATYTFAWVLRGKVGQPSKPLESVICVAFLPFAFSLVGGELSKGGPFFHAFIVSFVAHAVWLRLVRSIFPSVKQNPYYELSTEMGMFRYLPMLGLFLTRMAPDHTVSIGGDLLTGVCIVALDNLGHFCVKKWWRLRAQ